jgi:hypothetical protein
MMLLRHEIILEPKLSIIKVLYYFTVRLMNKYKININIMLTMKNYGILEFSCRNLIFYYLLLFS